MTLCKDLRTKTEQSILENVKLFRYGLSDIKEGL